MSILKPFFSIIIPTFNRSKFIKNNINKLKIQSFTNWECIIIDDGSTDNTKELINLYTSGDNRFFYYYQNNLERSVARNNGASKSNGIYYIFLDSDDEFEINHLELLFEQIEKTGFIKGMYFTNGKIKSNNTIDKIDNLFINKNIPLDFFIDNSIVPARVCLHNSILKTLSFDPNAIVVEDTVLWTEILDLFPVIHLPINTVIYNLHDDNSINIQKYNAYKKRLKGLKILFYKKLVGQKLSVETKKKHLNNCYLGIIQFHKLNKNYLKKSFWVILSLIKYPNKDFKYKVLCLFNLK